VFSVVGIAVSNPAEGVGIRLLRLLYVMKDELITGSEESYHVCVRVCLIVYL
jgi:hypothetical protein